MGMNFVKMSTRRPQWFRVQADGANQENICDHDYILTPMDGPGYWKKRDLYEVVWKCQTSGCPVRGEFKVKPVSRWRGPNTNSLGPGNEFPWTKWPGKISLTHSTKVPHEDGDIVLTPSTREEEAKRRKRMSD